MIKNNVIGSLTLSGTLANAPKLIDFFERLTANISYESKGILFSEMFFLVASIADLPVQRILESGRGRAQSTLILGQNFAQQEIISIEHNASSPDVEVAENRLRKLKNVSLRYGDSVDMIPKILKQGDIVLIDGPKYYKGLRLCLQLLQTGRTSAVFIHDCSQGTLERKFLERFIPGAFFSDAPDFVEMYSHIDDSCKGVADSEGTVIWNPHQWGGRPQRSYGFTLACVPLIPSFNYRSAILRLNWIAFWHRFSQSILKRISFTDKAD